jgi:hypothetical protein
MINLAFLRRLFRHPCVTPAQPRVRITLGYRGAVVRM